MHTVFYVGNVDEIRDSIMKDMVSAKTHANVESNDISEAFKKDTSILNMKSGEMSFFSDYTIYTIYDSQSKITDDGWASITDHIVSDDASSTDGFNVSGFNIVNPNSENVLCVSVKSIPAKFKKKMSESGRLHIVECSAKKEQDTAKLYLKTIDTLPVRAHGPMISKVGREVHLLPLMIAELRARYGEDLSQIDVSSLNDQTVSVDIQKAPWDLTDAIDANRISDALRLSRILCNTKTSHVGVAVILRNHYAQMHRVWAAGVTDEKQAAQMLQHKGSTYPLKKAIQTARKYDAKLPAMVSLCDDAYANLTGGSSLNRDIIVDILVARLAAM